MADWRKLARDLALADGRIDEKEAAIIRRELLADAVIDKSEMEFLLEIRKGAQYIVPALNQLIFQVVKKAVLADGSISAGEAAWLRRWIMADGKVDDDEKRFLQELKRDAQGICPEFQALCDECLSGRPAPAAGRFRRKCQQCAKEFQFGDREMQPLTPADQAVCAKHIMNPAATIKVGCPHCGFAVLLPRPAAPTAAGLIQASQAAPPRPVAPPPPPRPAPPERKHSPDQEALAQVAIQDANWRTSESAAKQLIDQKLIARVATTARDEVARIVAVLKLEDTALLAKIAKSDKEDVVRRAAEEMLAKKTPAGDDELKRIHSASAQRAGLLPRCGGCGSQDSSRLAVVLDKNNNRGFMCELCIREYLPLLRAVSHRRFWQCGQCMFRILAGTRIDATVDPESKCPHCRANVNLSLVNLNNDQPVASGMIGEPLD